MAARRRRSKIINAPPETIEQYGRIIKILEDDSLETMGEWDGLSLEITYAPNQNDHALRDTI